MNIFKIPFNKHLAIGPSDKEKDILVLQYSSETTNHLGTIHAGAQFTLAEACSANYLITRFPEYIDGYLAVLRTSEVKYKRQTKGNIYAVPTCDENSLNRFKTNMARKHRSFVDVRITIKDELENTTMQGTYEWYVQRIKEEIL